MTWLVLALVSVLTVWAARAYRRWRDLEDRRIRNDHLRQYRITPRINHQLSREDES
jgi:hypothetical protein